MYNFCTDCNTSQEKQGFFCVENEHISKFRNSGENYLLSPLYLDSSN